jgi:hypothetical protein
VKAKRLENPDVRSSRHNPLLGDLGIEDAIRC